jgi:hypothetical protein
MLSAKVHIADVEAGPGVLGAREEREARAEVGDASARDAETASRAPMDRAQHPAVCLRGAEVHVRVVGLVPELPREHARPCVLHDRDDLARVLDGISSSTLPARLGRDARRTGGHPTRCAAEDSQDPDVMTARTRDGLVEP